MQEEKKKIVIALRKAKTSIEKIIVRIEEEEAECFPAIQQTLSAIGLLRSVNMLMLENHMKQAMTKHTGTNISGKQMKALQEEILKIVKTSQDK
ncbi:MAG: metal-sensing transcriptional repressor [Candidatus Moranbacteria bacterium]|nr:metal-sensing transcriptional repressor [Candidatus Moranbacteria bacterium]MDD3965095.1 metal-sensing transcriptional repressor [Candidatus Moranbacteria bacterium]